MTYFTLTVLDKPDRRGRALHTLQWHDENALLRVQYHLRDVSEHVKEIEARGDAVDVVPLNH